VGVGGDMPVAARSPAIVVGWGMRVAILFGALLFTGSMWLGACGPPYPVNAFCNGNGKKCSCDNTPGGCNYDCAGPGCDVDCHNAGFCDVSCGDSCNWDCHDADTCDGVCGDNCNAECHNADVCTLECGADCNVDCHDLERCSVTMISGTVHCHGGTDVCDIRCALPGGSTVPADEFDKDRWGC
jgi:hypothetical protein